MDTMELLDVDDEAYLIARREHGLYDLTGAHGASITLTLGDLLRIAAYAAVAANGGHHELPPTTGIGIAYRQNGTYALSPARPGQWLAAVIDLHALLALAAYAIDQARRSL